MKKQTMILNIVWVTLLLALIIWLNTFLISYSDTIRDMLSRFGYVSMFILAVVSGFNFILPIPVIGFYPLFAELGFAPFLIVLVLSLGMTLGNSIGYMVGHMGKDIVRMKSGVRVRTLFDKLYTRHQVLPFFLLFFYTAFVPLPNELLVIPMALAGYRFRSMGILLFLGNFLFNIIGAFGIMSIISLL